MGGSTKILIVDDEQRMCDSLKTLLIPQGYEIGMCHNGYEAMKCLNGHVFHLVLLDIFMEGMDGFQVMEKMARQNLDIPVIIMTGDVSTSTAVDAFRKGACDYLRKPFEPQELYTSLKNVFNQRKLEEDNRRVNQNLRESEELFQKLLQTSLTVSVQSYGLDGVIHYWNPASERLYGYSAEEAVGRNLMNLIIPPEMREEVVLSIQHMVETGKPILSSERSLMRKDGSRIPVFSSHAVIQVPGRPPELFCMDIDLSELKQSELERENLQAQTRQFQKAESLNRMAGAIAHHFNNQLMIVMGNLELGLDKIRMGDSHLENLTEAMEATRKAAEVSSLMLTYLGQTNAQIAPLDICEVCNLSLPLLLATLPKRILLKTNLVTPGPIINGNVNQIQQVLTILVTNAQEAIEKGLGAIELTVRTVLGRDIKNLRCHPIKWQPREDVYACLEVVDAGCGIAEKDIEQVFDPFFTTKFAGRGMGLSVVSGILKTHQGAITVKSEAGQGSIFRVYLPVLSEKVIHSPKKEATSVEIEGGGTVLIVEDEEQIRKMVNFMLSSLGFTVLEARDGIEAVEVFRQYRDEISCVLSDLAMPRMDGWETLSALRALSPGIPVVLTSGYNISQVMAVDHPERPNAFLQKPFSVKDLAAVIRRSLANGKLGTSNN